jgi:hypothetical protein
MDFFTVPTITFGILYCFFVISHERRRILHFNVTCHPTSTWIVQQLREACPYESAPDSCSSITTRNTAWKYPLPFAPYKSLACKPRSQAPGRMVSPSVGWGAAAASCSTM